MLPNNLVRSYLHSLEDLLGENGVKAILNVSDLADWIDNFPPDDSQRDIEIESFARLQSSLEEIYGQRAGLNLSRKAAQNSFTQVGFESIRLDQPEASGAVNAENIKTALSAFVSLFDYEDNGKVRWTGTDEDLYIQFETCPNCAGREVQIPICEACGGWIEGLLTIIGLHEKVTVIETDCLAAGADSCKFHIQAG